MSEVLCDRKLPARVKGKMYKSVVTPVMLNGMKMMTVTERRVGKNENCRVKNGEMDTGSDKKEQDKKRICERQDRIKAGDDGAAAPGPPLYQVNKIIKITDTITFKI